MMKDTASKPDDNKNVKNLSRKFKFTEYLHNAYDKLIMIADKCLQEATYLF